ncbi:GLEYA adhesin domain protein [Metarhizium robertsii ARSEF 23]|uniref:GLEYA adhesin domain protein n=1 Tax=Metarhizium robertsii (strain ARSEF 23 / ATCC MYA-3075) TaxID=655844 RepID=E9F1A3_METRA|nr:GLEYA adhesin domain protein [Metarhizium robertsii ARSEF 23]EFY98913.2 GLEYA adhesin domain protein [Metarhizium robertsii ARSEF 23]
MHRRLLSTAYLVVSALRVILAQDFNPESLLPQHKSPLLGDICKSLRTACDITEFPASIEVWYITMHQLSTWLTLREKLCDEYCESEIAASDLKGRLCKNFRKYIESLGKCAKDARSTVKKQCKDKCRCSKDDDCDINEVCKDYACNPKCTDGKCLAHVALPPKCTKNSDCRSGLVCRDGDCRQCRADSECHKDMICSNDHCMPKPPTCGQPGFDWAEWRGPLSWNSVKSPPFTEYDPTVFKSQRPEHGGRTNTLLIDNPEELYGQTIDINLASVIHQGFLLAPETGNYTFIFGQADDIVLVWLGENAFRGWTRANADIERTYIPPPGDETRTTRHLEQGTYYPIRVAWGDKGGNTAMSVRIMAPNGTELTGQNGGYFRTEACDGSYDKFPPYGRS